MARKAGLERRVLIVCIAALAWLVLWAGPVPTASSAIRGAPAVHTAAYNGSGPELRISPAAWWMLAGSTVALVGVWTVIPPGCTLQPAWFLWSFGPGGAEGTFAPPQGPAVNFSAQGVASGVTELVVRSAGMLACGNTSHGVIAVATSNLTVEAPLALGDLTVTPNPVAAGGAVVLTGTISGGAPPYQLRSYWGDGNVSATTRSAAGTFSVATDVPAGAFRPVVVASDAVGEATQAEVDEAINASTSFAAALRPSSPLAEVGVPVELSVTTVHEPPTGFSSAVACANATGPSEAGGSACTFGASGVAVVTFEGVGASFPYPEASATLDEPVAPPLGLALPGTAVPAEAGRPAYVPVAIEGGVPPVSLTWKLVGTPTEGTAVVPSDGMFFVEIDPVGAGADLLSVRGIDAVGASAAPVEGTVDVGPAVNGSVSASTSPGPADIGVAVSLSIDAGTSPFAWSIAVSAPMPNATIAAGTLSGPGSVPLSWRCDAEGTLAATVVVVDASGAAWTGRMSVPTVPRLAASVAFGAHGSGTLRAEVTIGGGVPPFALRIDGADGEEWNGTFASDGSFAWSGPTSAVGALALNWSVIDRYAASAAGSAEVVEGPAPAPSAAGLWVPLGVVAGLGAIAAVFAWRRRRAGPTAAPIPDPVETLRAIVEPADGADRALVELEAEEAGVPLPVVRETLDRLVRTGQIRSERGEDGEEVLAWERRRY